jgi:hypothetical protein
MRNVRGFILKPNYSLEDIEGDLRSCISRLFMVYNANGGDATHKTIYQLLKEIDRLGPYLEQISKIPDPSLDIVRKAVAENKTKF